MSQKGSHMNHHRETGGRRRLSVLKCQRGATAIEYGLILALITLVVVGSMTNVATKTVNMWSNVSNKVNAH